MLVKIISISTSLYLLSNSIGICGAQLLSGNPAHNIQLVKSISRQIYSNRAIADLMAAQAILESNLGGRPSSLAINHNNLFGIKCDRTASSCTSISAKEYTRSGSVFSRASFSHNSSLIQSFDQHYKLLNRPRYSKVLLCTTFICAATAVKRAGYATDPNYVNKLIAVKNRYLK